MASTGEAEGDQCQIDLLGTSISDVTAETHQALTFLKVDESDKQPRVHVQNSMMGPAAFWLHTDNNGRS